MANFLLLVYDRNFYIEVLIIFIVSLLGSLCKIYVVKTKSGFPLSLFKVLSATLTATIITISIEPFLMESVPSRAWFAINFVIGMLGDDILKRLTSIEGTLSLIKDVRGTIADGGKENKTEIHINVNRGDKDEEL